MSKKCLNCGEPISENDLFCGSCGAPNKKSEQDESDKSAKSSASGLVSAQTVQRVLKSQISASAMPGETVIGESGAFSGNEVFEALNPLKLVFSEAKALIRKIKSSIKDKKKLIPIIIIAVVWATLSVLTHFGINPLPIKALSFLTFSQGGISNNVFHMLGGLVGKGVFAYFFSALIFPIFRGQNPLKSITSGVKSVASRFKNIGSNPFAILLGLGIALIAYNFMIGHARLGGSMAAVSGALLSFRAIGNSNGFLFRFFKSVTGKFNSRQSNGFEVKGIIAGMSVGFAASISISLVPLSSICYLLGTAVIIAAFIVLIVNTSRKGAKAQ